MASTHFSAILAAAPIWHNFSDSFRQLFFSFLKQVIVSMDVFPSRRDGTNPD
ncbi:MAG: hypothetical protein KGN37_05655 [Burkholderiales bacterium]|nr:hypothetical protein [Burkholderiales bacterium]